MQVSQFLSQDYRDIPSERQEAHELVLIRGELRRDVQRYLPFEELVPLVPIDFHVVPNKTQGVGLCHRSDSVERDERLGTSALLARC